ncbi:hypothetical protein D3C76_1754680 [compost metagenome]
MWGLILQFFLIKYFKLLKNNILIFYCWLAEFLQCVMCGNTRQMAAAAAQAGCYQLATVQSPDAFLNGRLGREPRDADAGK